MSKKMILLALAAVSAAMFAMPTVASAGEWELHNAGAFTITKVTNPQLSTDDGDTVTCGGLTGTGAYTTKTTGNISLNFTGCHESTFGTTCTTDPNPLPHASGQITVVNKVFHNVIIGNAGDNNTPIGITITGGSEFTTFVCAGGLITIKVTGNVIGEIESPNCPVPAKTYNVEFKATSHGVQKYRQVTTTGPIDDLVSHVNGVAHTSAQQGTGRIHFPANVTPTCT